MSMDAFVWAFSSLLYLAAWIQLLFHLVLSHLLPDLAGFALAGLALVGFALAGFALSQLSSHLAGLVLCHLLSDLVGFALAGFALSQLSSHLASLVLCHLLSDLVGFALAGLVLVGFALAGFDLSQLLSQLDRLTHPDRLVHHPLLIGQLVYTQILLYQRACCQGDRDKISVG